MIYIYISMYLEVRGEPLHDMYISMYLEVRKEPLHDAFPASIQLQVKSNLFNGLINYKKPSIKDSH